MLEGFKVIWRFVEQLTDAIASKGVTVTVNRNCLGDGVSQHLSDSAGIQL
jgi:hypothetical protein